MENPTEYDFWRFRPHLVLQAVLGKFLFLEFWFPRTKTFVRLMRHIDDWEFWGVYGITSPVQMDLKNLDFSEAQTLTGRIAVYEFLEKYA
jgi:hypothetical protein